MSLTLAGVPILFDWNGVAAEFLSRYSSLEDLVLPPDSSARDDWQNNPVGKNQRVGLPRTPFTDRPELRLNCLCWPATHAARWAFGIFLVNGEGKAAIEALDCTVAHTLECKTPIEPDIPGTDGQDYHIFQAQMHVLAIRRISGASGSICEDVNDVVTASDLSLIVLVDYRWFLQFRNINDPTFDEDCSGYCTNGWDEFYQYVADRAGYPDAVSTAVIKDAYAATGVDCREFNRKQYNAAVVLDAIAASIGCRVVFPFVGGIALSDGATGRTVLEANLAAMKNQLAGNTCPLQIVNTLPESVEVSFPKSICGQACNDERFIISKPTGSACAVPDTIKTFHSTSYADYACPTCGGSGGGGDCDMAGSPSNYDALNALATQIAADFIALSYYRYEFTFSSPQAWIPCAFDDWIIINFGTEWQCDLGAGTEVEDNAAGLVAHTTLTKQFWRSHQIRVQSLTMAAFPNSLLHGSTVGVIPDNDTPTWATATECIELCGTGAARLKYRDCTGALIEFDAECVDVTIDNRDCLIFALPGDTFRVEKPCGSQCWYPAERFGLQRGAQVTGCVPCDELGLATFWSIPNPECGGGSGGVGVSCVTELTDCTVEFWNTSGRVLGCLGPEQVSIAVAHGTCCWFINSVREIPHKIMGTLSGSLCQGDPASIGAVEWIGACGTGLTKPTTAENPLGLVGCQGKAFLAEARFTDCDCEWIITQVEPELQQVVEDVLLECLDAGACGLQLKKKLMKEVALWSCDATVCEDSAEFEDAGTITGENIDVVTEIALDCETSGGGCGGLIASVRSVCILCPGADDTGEVIFPFAEVNLLSDISVDCTGSGGCGGITKTYKTFCLLCDSIDTTTDTIPFTEQTFVTAVSGTDGGCGGSGEGDCAVTYNYKSVCGLFCDTASGSATAFTMQPVEVLTPPDGDYCDCSGLSVGKKTILAMCVCDEGDEKILSFVEKRVYDAGSDASIGSGGSSGCYVDLPWTTILTLDCPDCFVDTGVKAIITGQTLTVVTEVTCDAGCPAWQSTEVCVLVVGESYDDTCDCSDCPDPPDPCPSGSGA